MRAYSGNSSSNQLVSSYDILPRTITRSDFGVIFGRGGALDEGASCCTFPCFSGPSCCACKFCESVNRFDLLGWLNISSQFHSAPGTSTGMRFGFALADIRRGVGRAVGIHFLRVGLGVADVVAETSSMYASSSSSTYAPRAEVLRPPFSCHCEMESRWIFTNSTVATSARAIVARKVVLIPAWDSYGQKRSKCRMRKAGTLKTTPIPHSGPWLSAPSAWPRGSPCTTQPQIDNVNVGLDSSVGSARYFFLFDPALSPAFQLPLASAGLDAADATCARFHVGLTVVTYSRRVLAFARILFHAEERCRSRSENSREAYSYTSTFCLCAGFDEIVT